MATPIPLFPQVFPVYQTGCPEVRSWLASCIGRPGRLFARILVGADLQFGTSNVIGQVMSSHHHRPLARYQTIVCAEQAAQNGLGVSGIEVLGRFVEQHDPGG